MLVFDADYVCYCLWQANGNNIVSLTLIPMGIHVLPTWNSIIFHYDCMTPTSREFPKRIGLYRRGGTRRRIARTYSYYRTLLFER